MGKLFFNDPLWDIYDVVITVDAYSVSQSMHSSFEQWVRTAKTLLVDCTPLPASTRSLTACHA